MKKADLDQIAGELGENVNTVVFSLLLLILILGGLLWITRTMTNSESAYNYLILLLGALCGWVLGIFFAPYTAEEAKKLVTFRQAISAFISGYVLSKLDRFLEASLFVEGKVPQYDTWIRLGLFVAATAIFALGTFTCRAYFNTKTIKQEAVALNPEIETAHEKVLADQASAAIPERAMETA